ncbi:MAG: replication-associated recombination protein A, partial [Candidatus Omnitrophica bacterium]|nr:replication-associated recombination protein A [Candidatus Omnitrophota bacterium]
LVVASSALEVSEFVGMPEARIPLAQAAIYVACAPKSNASYLAIEEASKDIEENKVQDVPEHLKDASYPGAKKLGHGQGYKYPHAYEGNFVEQQYCARPTRYYRPSENGQEAEIKKRLEKLRPPASPPQNDGRSA